MEVGFGRMDVRLGAVEERICSVGFGGSRAANAGGRDLAYRRIT
jgi:hypothetical protein